MTEVAVTHLAPLAEALDSVDARWVAALGGTHSSAVADDDLEAVSDADLVSLNEAVAAVGRRCQVLHAKIANAISKRSAPDRGKDGLARRAGYPSPAKLIAAATGGHPADAQKLIQVGEATEGRMTFSGERAPARHPYVAAALDRDGIGREAASAIICLLDRLACRADRDTLADAEKTLVQQAAGLSLPDVRAILRRAEAYLDPDGLEPKIRDLRSARYLKIWEDQHGMINLDAKLDPATGAPIRAAVDALVTAQIRAMRGRNQPGSGAPADAGRGGWTWDANGAAVTGLDDAGAGPDGTVAGAAGADGADPDAAGADGAVSVNASHAEGASGATDLSPLIERRTVQQLQADALAALAKHALGCDQTALPLATTTVIVRIPLEALDTGAGVATIDGTAQPVDAGTARRMAADAEIIPMVLGADSEVLDHGRARRLFTRAQRLSLWERDGGCARCGAPPEMCEAHHLRWWSRGGTTDLDNGILLCTSCHHSIHKDDWDIRIDGNHVWFIPPAHIDPGRTPRAGGRRRYDYLPAA